MSSRPYAPVAPSRAEIDAIKGPVVVEFGTDWCGFCRAAQPVIAAGLGASANMTHLKFEDGQGRSLGRSFGVKLWPTLVFLRDGKEVERLVRPGDPSVVAQALARISDDT